MSDDVILYRIKAERFDDNQWWDCYIEILVNEKGKIISAEEKE